ncbi:MAG TPA: hypothetical protein VLD57_10785 [Blastocatellia bacterium]|nr:hypothetical protein [Blastocatellia bacterium]
MSTEKKENLMNEKINPRADGLADLPVADEQAQQAKGGGDVVPTTSFSLNFGAIKYEYKPQKEDDRL